MDNFTVAVIFGAIAVVVIFGLMFVFDKKVEVQESAPPSPPPKTITPTKPASSSKPARKRPA
jgi:hypothetical protein